MARVREREFDSGPGGVMVMHPDSLWMEFSMPEEALAHCSENVTDHLIGCMTGPQDGSG